MTNNTPDKMMANMLDDSYELIQSYKNKDIAKQCEDDVQKYYGRLRFGAYILL